MANGLGLASRGTSAVGRCSAHEFVSARFGKGVEEAGGAATDDARSDIVEGIGIEFSGFGFLSVDRSESESFRIARGVASASTDAADAKHTPEEQVGRCRPRKRMGGKPR